MEQLMICMMDDSVSLPSRATTQAAGLDFVAPNDLVLRPRDVVEVSLRVCVKIPEGHYGRIAARSSLARKGIVAAGGVIAADEPLPLRVVLIHCGSLNPVMIAKGDRIVQLICEKCSIPSLEIATFDKWRTKTADSKRGEQGFGSSGV